MSVPDLDGADFEPDLPALGDVFANNCPTIGAGDGGWRGDCGRGCGGIGRFWFGHNLSPLRYDLADFAAASEGQVVIIRGSSTVAAQSDHHLLVILGQAYHRNLS